MQLKEGQVVWSRKGRDVTKAYVVVGFEKEVGGRLPRVLLADGEKRTRRQPKAKNPLHLNPTNTLLPPDETDSDVKIKAALKAFAAKQAPKQQGG